MSGHNDGGPAFPALHTIDGNWVKEPIPKHAGMTLRDYFAAKAMAAAMHGATLGGMPGEDAHATELTALLAKAAYAVADAMLKAR